MTVLDESRLQRLGAFYRRAVDAGDLPGWSLAVHDGTRTVHTDHGGLRDLAVGAPVTEDTVFRLFSMTKPITVVAALLLVERDGLDLRTPVGELLGEFADTPVLRPGATTLDDVEPPRTPLALWHLMSHTAGLTYGFFTDPAAARYRAEHLGDPHGDLDLAATSRALADVPLLFQPGSAWNYSMGTDVLGRVVEVAGGAPLDRFLDEQVLGPLGMTDTAFTADPARTGPLYQRTDGVLEPAAWLAGQDVSAPPTLLSGGAGLWSTVADHQRFAAMLAAGGRTPEGRLLAPDTVRHLGANHLPGGADLQAIAHQRLEWDMTGLGFGLGVAVVRDPVARRVPSRAGEFWWNGAGGGSFLIDPSTGVSATFLTSVRAADNSRWEAALHQLVHAAYRD